MSHKSTVAVPIEDLEDYATTMLGSLIRMGLHTPTDEIWDEIVLDTDSAENSMAFARRITKIVKLVNDYRLKDSSYKIEYDFVGRTTQVLADYEAKNGKPICSL